MAVQDLLKAQGSIVWDFKYVTATIMITELLQNAVPRKAKNLIIILHGGACEHHNVSVLIRIFSGITLHKKDSVCFTSPIRRPIAELPASDPGSFDDLDDSSQVSTVFGININIIPYMA